MYIYVITNGLKSVRVLGSSVRKEEDRTKDGRRW